MEPYSPESKVYPQFILKSHSKILGGNVCISLVGIFDGLATLAITIFDSTGEKCFDSFSLETHESTLTKSIASCDLVQVVEKIYISMQAVNKNLLEQVKYVH